VVVARSCVKRIGGTVRCTHTREAHGRHAHLGGPGHQGAQEENARREAPVQVLDLDVGSLGGPEFHDQRRQNHLVESAADAQELRKESERGRVSHDSHRTPVWVHAHPVLPACAETGRRR